MTRLAGWLTAPIWFLVALCLVAQIVIYAQSCDTMDEQRVIY